MGFCSWISSKVKSAYKATKEMASSFYNKAKGAVKGFVETVIEVKDRMVEVAKTVKQKVTNMASTITQKIKDGWDIFTGRKNFDEAKTRYNELIKKYNNKKSDYEDKVNRFAAEIKKIVESINAEKQYIIETLFIKMKNVLSKIKLDNKYSLEYFKMPKTKVEALRTRDDLFLIDFDKSPVKTTLQAVFSLGIWTRKKARETLDRIIEEEKKTEEIFVKMDAEIARMDLLHKALMQTLTYLKDMEAMYENIVYKANNTAKYLRFKCMQFTHGISREFCKLSALPKADQDLMFALFNFTEILNKIVKMELVGKDKGEINDYKVKLEMHYAEYREKVAA